jgi:hypothetical protein
MWKIDRSREQSIERDEPLVRIPAAPLVLHGP